MRTRRRTVLHVGDFPNLNGDTAWNTTPWSWRTRWTPRRVRPLHILWSYSSVAAALNTLDFPKGLPAVKICQGCRKHSPPVDATWKQYPSAWAAGATAWRPNPQRWAGR